MQTFWNTKKECFLCALYLWKHNSFPRWGTEDELGVGKGGTQKQTPTGGHRTDTFATTTRRPSFKARASLPSSQLRCSKRTCPFAGIFHILDYDDRGKSWKCKRCISNILQKIGSKDILLKVFTWNPGSLFAKRALSWKLWKYHITWCFMLVPLLQHFRGNRFTHFIIFTEKVSISVREEIFECLYFRIHPISRVTPKLEK